MKLSIVIHSSPATQAARTAYLYVQAALAQGHEIQRLFFYHDGVLNGSVLPVPPQDEFNLNQAWQELVAAHDIDAVVCVSSALKRGILNASEADRHEKPGHNLSEVYTLSGLGQLIEACSTSDRVISFGD